MCPLEGTWPFSAVGPIMAAAHLRSSDHYVVSANTATHRQR
jgi:hypothetical protein